MCQHFPAFQTKCLHRGSYDSSAFLESVTIFLVAVGCVSLLASGNCSSNSAPARTWSEVKEKYACVAREEWSVSDCGD